MKIKRAFRDKILHIFQTGGRIWVVAGVSLIETFSYREDNRDLLGVTFQQRGEFVLHGVYSVERIQVL